MKRVFTDADIYEDEWYMDLTTDQKLFWDYICRRAEYGFWKPNKGLAEFQLKIKIDFQKMLRAFNAGKERIKVLENGRWFIPSWVPFQYKGLSMDCKAHKPIYEFYRANYPYLYDSYLIAIGNLQEKEMDKDMEKEKKGVVRGKPTIEEVKAAFGEKGFPAEAERFFDYYEANGWRVGRNPMKNWRSAVANWLRNGKSFGSVAEKKREKVFKKDEDCQFCRGTGYGPHGVKCQWCWK